MNGFAQAAVPPVTGPALDNKRVAAAVIDLLVIFFVGLVLGLLAGGLTFAAAAVSVAWGLYYYFALECLTGQTLGKKVMGLRVARSDGRPPEMRQVAVRTVLRLVDGLGLYLVGLVVMLATGKRRQRLGDLAAETVITEAQEEGAHDLAPLEDMTTESAPVVPLQPAEDPPAPEPDPVPPPAAEEPLPFEHYKAPAPAPAPALAVEPAPAAVPPPPAEPHIELVPDPPTEGEKPRIEIVSPIDLVMGEDDPPADDDEPAPPKPA